MNSNDPHQFVNNPVNRGLAQLFDFLSNDTLPRGLILIAILIVLAVFTRSSFKSSALLKRIRDEVKPNHGSSMKDAVSRIESAVKAQGEEISKISVDVSELKRDSRLIHEGISSRVEKLEKS